jgi:hypothetical protein
MASRLVGGDPIEKDVVTSSFGASKVVPLSPVVGAICPAVGVSISIQFRCRKAHQLLAPSQTGLILADY